MDDIEEELLVECYSCGQSVAEEDTLQHEGELYCENCIATCDICGYSYPSDDLTYVEQSDRLYCRDCFDRRVLECRDCGELYDVRLDDGFDGRCEDCSEYYFVCDNCGEIYHNDDYGGDGLCEDCYDRQDTPELIRDYHDNPTVRFLPNTEENLYFGIELELENFGDRHKAAEQLRQLDPDEDLFYLMDDCSLRYGFEIISQPATLEHHQKDFPWHKIIVTALDGRGEVGYHSALHVHISNKFFEGNSNSCRLKMIHLVDKFRPSVLEFARTTEYLAGRSAQSHGIRDFNMNRVSKEIERCSYDRMMAVNSLSSRETTELRMFSATLDLPTLIGCIEFAHFLACLVKNNSYDDLDKLSWADIIEQANQPIYHYLYDQLTEANTRRISKGEKEVDTLWLEYSTLESVDYQSSEYSREPQPTPRYDRIEDITASDYAHWSTNTLRFPNTPPISIGRWQRMTQEQRHGILRRAFNISETPSSSHMATSPERLSSREPSEAQYIWVEPQEVTWQIVVEETQ